MAKKQKQKPSTVTIGSNPVEKHECPECGAIHNIKKRRVWS